MTNRRPWLKSLSMRWVEGPMLQRASAMHYTSRAEQTEAEAAGATARPFVIPLGIDLAPFTHLPSPELFLNRWPQARDRDLVLCLCRLDPIKGLDVLLRAFAEVKRGHPQALLVIAGRGEPAYETTLGDLAKNLGLANDVLWTGYLAGADKLSALAAANIFVLSSYSENFGLAAVEALAAGLPCVVAQGVAISTDVTEFQAGLVVPTEPGALAQAILHLRTKPDLRQQYAANARQLAEKQFSLGGMGATLRAVYQDVSCTRN
jgi:glycosyltransferase involved in cell wall biosynthesis